MAKNWREYQEEVAEFFRSLGCTAEIEKEVVGARGSHIADIWVTFRIFGIESAWLIECKFWKTAVPKEKVLVLHQIAQDVGADHAFLLSESGFQSGAIRAASSTNLTLADFEDLRENAKPAMVDMVMRSLVQDAHSIQSRLHNILILDDHRPGPWPGAELGLVVELLASVFAVKTIELPKAQAGEFPITLCSDGRCVMDAEQMVDEVSRELQSIKTQLVQLEANVAKTRASARDAVLLLSNAVRELLAIGEKALFGPNRDEQDAEKARLAAVSAMKQVGSLGGSVRPLVAGRAATDLHALMRALIDGVYLDLSQPVIERRRWEESLQSAQGALLRLSHSVGPTV